MFPRNQPYPYTNLPQNTQASKQSSAEVFLDLDKKEMTQILELIDKKEKIFYAGVVEKVNKHLTAQKRILVITNKAIYNIQPNNDLLSSITLTFSPKSALKRKIDIIKVFGITLSTSPISEEEEFIINVTKEYDYRYNGRLNREKIFKSILNAHFANTNVPFTVYTVDEDNLAAYHTTDDDFKAKIDKRPKNGKISVTPEIMGNGIGWIMLNRKELKQQQANPKPIQNNTFGQQPQFRNQNYLPNTQSPYMQNQEVPYNPNSTNRGPGPANIYNQPPVWNNNAQPNYYVPNGQQYQNGYQPQVPYQNVANNIRPQNQPQHYVPQQNNPNYQNYNAQNDVSSDLIKRGIISSTANNNSQISTNFEKYL